ncbi:hypothetical protein PAHAL_8G191300 [Panicum hallii]|uniref:CASP-like protein n=1 Tax=Panicum hallii TaxID=206008 RepID=A0A2S3IEF7_9POAL|nr:CASP-like protein 1U2 [Panicum hallii]PAN42841.1 hypothetical protein PAHAL_8G191300 [Panicum hallii]PAN42842.1 hypothetical protein PAHAL_8G191300 [Panicum hallii]
MGSGCHATDEAPNGSKAVTLLLRLSTMALALTSAVVMATASECTIYESRGARVTVTFKHYPPFVYLVCFNIAATILEAAGIYLQVGKGGDDDEEEAPKAARVLLVFVDVAVPALLNLATGAAFSAVVAYGPQISACTSAAGRFCEQVNRSKILSLAAGISAVSAAFFKDVQLPFSVWPVSSDDYC